MILLDTNILIYATDSLAPQHQDSKRIMDAVVQARALGIGTICTYNRTHFAGIEGIQALLPTDIPIFMP